MKQNCIFFFLLLIAFCSCSKSSVKKEKPPINIKPDEIELSTSSIVLERYGLVDIQKLDHRIQVDLKYASTDNFLSQKLYDLDKAYLQKEVAQKLVKAQMYLNTISPKMCFLIYDAVRPVDVQQKMWEKVKDTKYNRYVANPYRKSLHNYGAAVDLTIVDSIGIPLDMGTPFDYFGLKAGIHNEEDLKARGVLTNTQVENRKLLRRAMTFAGFYPIRGEWWHFNACSLEKAKEHYTLILTLDSFKEE